MRKQKPKLPYFLIVKGCRLMSLLVKVISMDADFIDNHLKDAVLRQKKDY